MKLVVEEPESDALNSWLSVRAGVMRLSSELATVEVMRACRQNAPHLISLASGLLETISLIALTRRLLEQASLVGTPSLRSLDAIHLASALSLASDLSAFVAYDRRLQAEAADAGLPVAAPD